ncbi:putative G-protein coupled receptor 139 [Arapaima gigas]
MDSQDEDWNFSIFQGVYFILVAGFGIPANLLSMVVLCGRRCGLSSSTVIYLVSLAVVDTLFLLLGGLVAVGFEWTRPTNSPPPSVSLCGAVSFNEGWTLCSSQWIVATFTLERYLVFCSHCPLCACPPWPRPCWWPSRSQLALLLVVLCVLGSQMLSLPLWWLFRTWPGGGEAGGGPAVTLMWRNVSLVPLTSLCQALPGSRDLAVLWAHGLLAGCLPMSLTLSFSVLVCRQFRRRARILAAPDNGAPFRSTSSRMQRSGRLQVTVALVAVFLALPYYIMQGLNVVLGTQVDQRGGWGVAAHVAVMLQWLSLVIHFLLYCFLSSGFRRETLVLVRRLCKRPRKLLDPRPERAPRVLSSQVWMVQDAPPEQRTSPSARRTLH